MANDVAIDFIPPRAITRSLPAQIVFVGLLFLMFVGLTPFAPAAYPTSAGILPAAAGDTLRQILYLSLFVPIVLTALLQRGLGVLRMVPLTLVLLLGWCFASAAWSAVPDVTLRRAALAMVVVLSVILSVELIGTERAFRIWRIFLAVILAVNWLSIPLIHTAVHLPGEINSSLAGDWRGLYSQKNTAGAVCVMTILLFLFSRNGRGNWIGWLVSAAALGFLVMTRSKTSLGLLPVTLAAGGLYQLAWRNSLGRAIFVCAALLLLVTVGALGAVYADTISHMLENPTQFTGRAEIWQASFAYLHDHALLGSGFGTIASTGALSPLHNYVRHGWVEAIADSHNGYLQIAVALGGIGFALAMLALVVGPLLRFWPLHHRAGVFHGLLFALFVFMVLHNFMESDFLESDNSGWFAMLVLIASQRIRDKSLTGTL